MIRTVYGIVDLGKRDEFPTMTRQENELLLCKQPDDTWFLPGCAIPDEAMDAEALSAAIRTQTGLDVRLGLRLHVAYASGNDHAVAYCCDWIRPARIPRLYTDTLRATPDSDMRRSLRILRACETDGETRDMPVPLPVRDRPHLWQLLLDAIVIQGTPLQCVMDEEAAITEGGIHECEGGKSLFGVLPKDRLMWSRILFAQA